MDYITCTEKVAYLKHLIEKRRAEGLNYLAHKLEVSPSTIKRMINFIESRDRISIAYSKRYKIYIIEN